MISRIWATLKSPEFWHGFTHAFDIFPDPEIRGYLHKSEAEAIASDWGKVGGDMRRVIDELERKIAEEKAK